MKNKNTNKKYPVATKILTWILYIIIFATIVLGWLGGIYSIKKGYAAETSETNYYYRSNEYTYTSLGTFTPERWQDYGNTIPFMETTFSTNSTGVGSYQLGFSFETEDFTSNNANIDILLYNTWLYASNNYMQDDITSYLDYRIVFSAVADGTNVFTVPDSQDWLDADEIFYISYVNCPLIKYSDNSINRYIQVILFCDTLSSLYDKPTSPVANPFDFIRVDSGSFYYTTDISGQPTFKDDFTTSLFNDFNAGYNLRYPKYDFNLLSLSTFNYFCFTTSTGARFTICIPYYTYSSINTPNHRTFYTINSNNSAYIVGFDDGVRKANTDMTSRLKSNYSDGYNDGYYKAKEIYETGDFGVMQLADAVSFGFLKPIYSLFNFNLLGINFYNLFTSIFTISVVLFVLHLIFG